MDPRLWIVRGVTGRLTRWMRLFDAVALCLISGEIVRLTIVEFVGRLFYCFISTVFVVHAMISRVLLH